MDAPEITYRRFDDIDGQRQDIYDMAKTAIGAMRPVANASHQLEIADVDYDGDFGPSLDDEKQAILKRKSLRRALKGTVRLKDIAGNVVDEQRITLANVPHLNSRGLFIRDGVTYALRNQMRLRPGVYTRQQKSGGTESHFNVKPGTGRGFRIEMEPESGLFKMKVDQSTTRLYPVLRALGVSDDDMRQSWGDELFDKNHRARSGKDELDLTKLVKKLGKDGLDVSPDKLPEVLKSIIERTEVDEDTSELTLGERIKNLAPKHLLQATVKQLQVARGEHPGDNRDSQAFQSFHGPQDLLAERIRRDAVGSLRNAFWKASKNGNLKNMQPGVLDKNITSLFDGSGLSQTVEDINPLETYDQRQAITRLGEGGIRSNESISRDARNVQASYAGVIDSSRAPECYDSQTEVMTFEGWKPWPLITGADKLAGLVNGKLIFSTPESLYSAPYNGVMFGAKNNHIDYLVTPNHRMYTRTNGNLRDGRKCAWKVTTPDYIQGKSRLVLSSGFGSFEPINTPTVFDLPTVKAIGCDRPIGNKKPPVGASLNKPVTPIDMGDWLEFLGWYISEGSCQTSNGHYVTNISQDPDINPDNVKAIEMLLNKMPFSWSRCHNCFNICGKQLAMYLSIFGKSDTKFLPEYAFSTSVEHRSRLFNALMSGDGRSYKGGAKRTYCTGSSRLANDFVRLAFSLGKSAKLSIYIDPRNIDYLPVHEIYVHTRTERLISNKPPRRNVSDYYTVEDYDGMVYCATVPGGLLYVRRTGSCGFWCGNSSNIGVDLRVTDAALRGSDNQLYTTVRNLKTGQIETVSARTLSTKNVTFPGELKNTTKRIIAIKNDKLTHVLKGEIDYEIVNPEDLMSRASRLIPFPESVKGQRLLMGARMTQQAVPLKEPEAPFVQTSNSDGGSLHRSMGKDVGAKFSPTDGIVTKVTSDSIELTGNDGVRHKIQLYNNYPLARKTALHNEPVVKVGSLVKTGEPIAKSNFTDKSGTFSIGRNLRTAYMSAEGDTIEDAFVISESAAKKLGAEAMYKTDLDMDGIKTTGKGDYSAIYAGKFKPNQLDTLDDDGIIKVGAQVQKGDPLILAVGDKPMAAIGALMKSPKSSVSDKAQVWEHNAPGVVTDVVRTKNGIRVVVKSYDVANVGDKLAPRFGKKGVISSSIRPDDQMPVSQDGKPIEVIANTNGVLSRVNPSALAESLLGKIVERTGRAPYVIKGFSKPEGVAEFALNEAQKYGVPETETVTDPRDGRKIPNIFVGNTYIMRLHHKSEGKLSARDQAGYTTDDYPAKGGPEGSKRISLLDQGTLLAAGATDFIKDAKLARGQKNDDYWRQVRHGETPMLPNGSFADEQFKSMLKGAGINIKEDGTKEQLRPLLDTDVDRMAIHEVKNAGTFDFETMAPIKDGLFDIGTTGGAGGNRFSKITLPVKVPHPMFMDPIKRILGLTGKEMNDVMSGKEQIQGLSGPDAIQKALEDIDVDREMENAKTQIKTAKGNTRDAAIKRLHFLAGLKKMHVAPAELMVSKVAVVPPRYRPVTRGTNVDTIHDLNYLYKDLLEAKKNYEEAKTTFGDSGDEYLTLIKAVHAVSGMEDPVNPKTAEQGVKGILRYAIGLGDTPKAASYQRKVIGTSVDTVGRSVITSDRHLGMDQIGVPEEMAWKIFRPYIIRKLVTNGMPPAEAVQAVEDRTPAALSMLDSEMEERPVVYNRAPALHRYAYQGAWAKRVSGDSIHVPYATLKAQGSDFDGDALNVHAPSTDDAIKDVKEKLMPSKNLFYTGNFETHYEPMQDYTAGLYLAGRMDPKQKPVTFNTVAEAKAAYAKGQISARTPITILQA